MQHCKGTYSHLELSKHNDFKKVRKAASSKIKQFKMQYNENFFLKHSDNVKKPGTK